MALIWRVTARWTGGNIGTGFTNLFFTEGVGTAQQAVDAVKAFFTGSYGVTGNDLPSGITIAFPSGVDVVEDATGVLTVTVPVTAPSALTGGDSGSYAAPAGACVSWLTGAVVNGRHVRGRTFLVPLGGDQYQNDGTLASTIISNVNAAAAALISAAPELVVWSRPESAAAGGGSSHPVVAHRLNDFVSVLRSRR